MNKTGTGREYRTGVADEALARVAHLYYILGLTQAEVAARLDITRFKVNRMLAQARKNGMVRIEINVPYVERFELERALERKFGLETSFVCPSDASDSVSLSEVIGTYAAMVISETIEDGMVIATSWGETLRALALAINPDVARNLCVVAMLGALTSQTDLDKFDAASTLASRLGAECLYIPGPIICDSVRTRDAINAQPAAQRAIAQARSADLALLSIGGLGMSSLRRATIIRDQDYSSTLAAGAIGNLLGRFIGKDGKPIDHPFNDRAVGVGPEEIFDIPRRILCAGGPHKVEAIRVALTCNYANALITDVQTARALLAEDPF